MYRRIVIAVDPEGLSGEAAPAVAAVAAADAEVLIVLVWDLSQPPARRRAGEEALEHLFGEVRAHHLRARLDRRDAPEGRVAEEIAAAARGFGADLVVIGSHRRGDLFTFFKGSVGHALASRLSTPLMIVGIEAARPAGGRRIVVGVDGGSPSREGVAAAVSLSTPETDVTVVHVDTAVGGRSAHAPRSHPPASSPAGRWLIEEELAVFSAAGVRAHGRQVSTVGGVGAALARVADEANADLIVVGSTRPGHVRALLLGSVAHELIARTQRTVLLASTEQPTYVASPTSSGPGVGSERIPGRRPKM